MSKCVTASGIAVVMARRIPIGTAKFMSQILISERVENVAREVCHVMMIVDLRASIVAVLVVAARRMAQTSTGMNPPMLKQNVCKF